MILVELHVCPAVAVLDAVDGGHMDPKLFSNLRSRSITSSQLALDLNDLGFIQRSTAIAAGTAGGFGLGLGSRLRSGGTSRLGIQRDTDGPAKN